MAFIQTIPLGEIPDRFEQAGLTPDCMADFLSVLFERWSVADHHYEMTCDFIHNEMDLDDEQAGMFLVYTIDELVRVASAARQATLTGKLLAYTVSDYVILLTFAEDP